jgi:hypothetical protein
LITGLTDKRITVKTREVRITARKFGIDELPRTTSVGKSKEARYITIAWLK